MEIATQTGHVAHPATGEWARYAIRLEALGDDRVSAAGTFECMHEALAWAGTTALLDRFMTR